MKIPLIWLQDYVDIKDKSPKDIAQAFTSLGLMLDKPLDDTGVLDLEHRMDRSDWLSIVGCARDLAAFFNLPLTLPVTKLPRLKAENLIPITIKSKAVRRFKTRVIKGIRIQPSPPWLADRLALYGIESKNNVVDITNYVMVELGQPMHAQDLAKLKSPEVTIAPAKKNQSITTLLGTNIKLSPDIFILSSGGIPTVIGGIVGGQATGVTDSTVDILLDAGNYNQDVIRKNSRKLKILNESVTRYDKFLDPRAIDLALDRATALILDLAGGSATENGDYYPQASLPQSQPLRFARLNLLSGTKFSSSTAKHILKRLGYVILEESNAGLTVEVPYHRTDVEVEDDLIADILRISDYNNIASQSLATPVPPDITSPLTRFEEKLRDYLVAQGAHEHITNSLVQATANSTEVLLANALSSDQNALRTSLLPGLEAVQTNYTKHQLSPRLLFELGKVFYRPTQEEHHLALSSSEDVRPPLAALLQSLGIATWHVNTRHEITIQDDPVGTLMSQTSAILKTDKLLLHTHPYQGIVSSFSHTTTLDLSLRLPQGMLFDTVRTLLENHAPTLAKLEVVEQYADSLLVRLFFQQSLDNVDKTRASLIKVLTAKGVVSRSG